MAEMVADTAADMEVHMVADTEVDKVADMVAGHGCWLMGPNFFDPNLIQHVSSKLCEFISLTKIGNIISYSMSSNIFLVFLTTF